MVDSPDDLYDPAEQGVVISPVTPFPVVQPAPNPRPLAWVPSLAGSPDAASLLQPEIDAAEPPDAAGERIRQIADRSLPIQPPIQPQGAATGQTEIKPSEIKPSEIKQPGPDLAVTDGAELGRTEQPLVILNLDAQYLESPVEELVSLPPDQLLLELMARVLLGGIGRLYFESYPQTGK